MVFKKVATISLLSKFELSKIELTTRTTILSTLTHFRASQVENNRALYVQRMSEGKESIKTPSDRPSTDISKADLTKPASLSDGEKAEPPQPADEAFLVEWDGDDDPLNPRSFSSFRKWLIIFIVSMGTLNV
jgi:hypothetical protein